MIRSCTCKFFGVLAHLSVIFFTTYITYLAVPGSDLFSWHPTFMSLGFVFFMCEAVFIYSNDFSPVARLTRNTKVKLHWIFQLLGTLFAWAGLIAIVWRKYDKGKTHLKSWHGDLGLATVFYVTLQALAGLGFFSVNKGKVMSMKLSQFKMLHAIAGLVGFLLVTAVLVTSMYTNWACDTILGERWYVCFAAILISIGAVLIQTATSVTARIGGAESKGYSNV